ncbi:metal ABC transporter ATP-binding protein [Candidatus Sumerlaeota bacterium]|nr:metal ABC transporter ATP-binding protein [Candidatus Sumerlaeota bacterium]
MQPVVIEVKDVWFSYDDHLVLKDVNLAIKKGDFLALLGPNGGGKTTLLKLMLGILKPDRGYIRILGKKPSEVADRLGYVPQDTMINKDFPISVMDVTLMGRLGHIGRRWRYSKKDRLLAEQALDRVGMLNYRNHLIGTLSGGERQRVFIARALVANPEFLFMDEPTSSVDSQWQTELYELLKELNKTVTIVVVSHDISVLSSYVKSVACVAQTVYFHDSAEITQETLEKVYHCPIELIAHGVPHRVLHSHIDKDKDRNR